jgi:hypothetical protein
VIVELLTRMSDISGWTVVGVLAVLVLVGRLVPRRTLLDAKAEAEYWRGVAQAEQAINAKQSALMEEVRLMLRSQAQHVEAHPPGQPPTPTAFADTTEE